jgi:hypothetical protein
MCCSSNKGTIGSGSAFLTSGLNTKHPLQLFVILVDVIVFQEESIQYVVSCRFGRESDICRIYGQSKRKICLICVVDIVLIYAKYPAIFYNTLPKICYYYLIKPCILSNMGTMLK